MMPQCGVCGEEDVYCDSGHYYCSTCNTQLQQYVEEEVGIDGTLGGGSHVVRKVDTENKDDSKDHGRPWVNAEAFTILLREQVDALIKLGAQKTLQDTVLRIWAAYLKKTKLAFVDNNHDQKEARQGAPVDDEIIKPADEKCNYNIRQRDLYLSTIESPEVKNVRSIKQYKKRGKTRSQEQTQQAAELVSTFGAEEFYAEDNPIAVQERELDVWDMIEEHDSQLLHGLEEKEGLEFKKLWNNRQKGPELMRVQTTLAMCYIGLLYNRHTVIPHDIIRWVREGLLPFNNGPSYFPLDMKLNDIDYRLFCSAVLPDAEKLEILAARLTKYLELDPKPTADHKQLICRFILELNLPGDLYLYAAAFHGHKKPCLAGHVQDNRPHYATVAMAYVIFTLKLVFKLNDQTERELSESTEEVLSILGPASGMKLFSWNDWVRHQTSFNSQTRLTDAKTFVNYKQTNTETPIKHFLEHVSLKRINKSSSPDEPSTEALSKIFKQLSEGITTPEITTRDKTQPQARSNDPRTHEDTSDLDEMLSSQTPFLDPGISTMETNSDGESYGNQEETIHATCPKDHSRDEEDFTSYTTQHLTHWTEFENRLLTGSSSEDTVYESCMDSSDESLMTSDEERLFMAPPKKRKSSRRSHVESVNESELRTRLAGLPLSDRDSWAGYVMYKTGKLDNCHNSYKWLVDLAARHTGTNPQQLHNFVQTLELVYLPTRDKKLSTKNKAAACVFQTSYFK